MYILNHHKERTADRTDSPTAALCAYKPGTSMMVWPPPVDHYDCGNGNMHRRSCRAAPWKLVHIIWIRDDKSDLYSNDLIGLTCNRNPIISSSLSACRLSVSN